MSVTKGKVSSLSLADPSVKLVSDLLKKTHFSFILLVIYVYFGDRSNTMVKVLCYKSEGRWFDPSRCQWIFH